MKSLVISKHCFSVEKGTKTVTKRGIEEIDSIGWAQSYKLRTRSPNFMFDENTMRIQSLADCYNVIFFSSA